MCPARSLRHSLLSASNRPDLIQANPPESGPLQHSADSFGSARVALRLTPAGLRAVRSGHPWLFESGIAKAPDSAPEGALAVLFDAKRRFVGIGLYDPNSPIRVRVLHQGSQLRIDANWLRAHIRAIIARRAVFANDPQTTGYRLIHGENDGLPGIVVDRYADTAVLKLDCATWLPHLSLLADAIPGERLVLRLSRSIDSDRNGDILRGPPFEGPLLFHENGVAFEADPIAGQKTGFFLDQRDNRARVGELARGLDVLNVFAYTGGFSLYAARGGAGSVTSQDISKPALAAAERNFALNPDLRTSHRCVSGDAFDVLADFAGAGRRFGMVILDPPSFARRQKEIPRALKAYRRLARLGFANLAKGGILVAASCSARVAADDFFDAVHSAGRLREIARTSHAADHPIGFPEGAYLKCLFARAD
jgi:23S rRNA (cytosine1962-C5)-methyltransferase